MAAAKSAFIRQRKRKHRNVGYKDKEKRQNKYRAEWYDSSTNDEHRVY